MRSLTNLSLSFVHITGDELGFLLSSSFSLEQLDLSCCSEIISLKIPCLQHLMCLKVSKCDILQVIESKAPNISSFHFNGDQQVQLLLGESLQLKKITISHSCVLRYARVMLPSTIPNLETLTIYSVLDEMDSPPMLPSKFVHLKYLNIKIPRWTFPPACDILLFISFLDACPCLETFHLHVSNCPCCNIY
uniref:At1g61320/AtMIF1 LRR domain-containing protein n=1 Tax=Hordeum vulgare subsp. vulgare TaxID=112509 RepID=A0A8I6YJ78_HORVV